MFKGERSSFGMLFVGPTYQYLGLYSFCFSERKAD